jgi:hypothetical protein
MAIDGYGTFALLPREIRDQIYEDLFSVANVKDIAEYARNSQVVFSAYVAQPDTSILRASRALYREALPVVFHPNFSFTRLTLCRFGRKSTKLAD